MNMKKIKIIKSRPLKKEEVVDQLPQDVAPEKPELTYESNPLEFILQKYPTLNKTLTDLLTEDFRDYIVGVYVMAPKPTVFKIVLHNNRSFYLTFLGDDKYQAKVSGRKYYLSNIGEFQRAVVAIADLLTLGTPPSTQGPEEELSTASEETPEETPTETPAETPEEGGEEIPELKESIKRFKLNLLENKINELKKLSFDVLTPEAQKIAQDLIKKLKITQDQIQPASSTNIVVYNDDRKNLIDKLEKLKVYGKRTDPNAGNFKVGKVSINFKPLKTSGEFYELKPQALGITTDKYISINQLKKELTNGIQNHKSLSDTQKKFILDLISGKSTLTPDEKKEIIDDQYFVKEVNKNLGEPLGAILYAKEVDGKSVLFPAAGNYPLVDYFMKTSDGTEIEVSAKTAKGKGNIIKITDVYKKIKDAGGKLKPEVKKLFDIASSTYSRATMGSLNLIPEFGDNKLKSRYKTFLKNNPGYTIKGDYDSAERVMIEKELIKQLNSQFNFNNLFQKYIPVIYVKYGFDETTLKPYIKIIKGEGFDVYLATKNSVNHDGERIGFQLA